LDEDFINNNSKLNWIILLHLLIVGIIVGGLYICYNLLFPDLILSILLIS
jgi:hypothetical protein